MAEHTIPQDVLGYEFKLFAGLTWKQFIYAAFGIGTGVLLLQSTAKGLLPPFIGYPLGILAILVPTSIGLVKIQGRSLETWISDALRIFTMPLIYAWQKNSQKRIKVKNALNSKPSMFPNYLKELFEKGRISRGINLRKHKNFVRRVLNKLIITPTGTEELAMPNIKLAPTPNTVAFLLTDNSEKPVAGVIATLQDKNGNIITQLKSNNKGVLYFSKSIPNGVYTITLSHPQYSFPVIEIYFDNNTYPLLKIKANNNGQTKPQQ